MTLPPLTPELVLAPALAAVALAALGLGLACRRLARRLAAAERALEAARADVAALCAAASGTDRRLAALERAQRRLDERQDRIELSHAGERAYDHAIRLVRNGADAERLVRECGLTPGEARLVLMLHGGQAAAAGGSRAAAGA